MSISFQGQRSISSRAVQNSVANEGVNEGSGFKHINEKFLFPFFDEVLRMVKLHSFFSFLLIVFFIVQIFSTFTVFVADNPPNFFINFNVVSNIELTTFPFAYLFFNILFFAYLFFSYRKKRIFSFWQLYLGSLFLNFFNVLLFTPVCGMCGYSAYQLDCIINEHNNQYYQSQNYQKSYNDTFAHPDNSKLFKFLPEFYTKQIFNGRTEKRSKRHFLNPNLTNFRSKASNSPSKPPNDAQEPTIKFNDDNEKDNLLMDSDFSAHVAVLIFSLIEANIIFAQIVLNFRLSSESPYLNRNIYSMWDSQVYVDFIFLLGLTQFMHYVLRILPNWCMYAYEVVFLISIIYILYYTLFQPFIHVSMNSFIQSSLTTLFLTTFLSIIHQIKSSHTLLLIIMFSLFFTIVFFIVFFFVNKKIIRNVNKKLSPPDHIEPTKETNNDDSIELTERTRKKNKNKLFMSKSERENLLSDSDQRDALIELSDTEKSELFDSFVFRSFEHALLYFRVGIMKASPYLVDFSFIRYMKESYNYNPIQTFILQISAFFPLQHQFLNFCMSGFNKRSEFLTFYEQFLMYQLYRINIIRQSSVSKEVQEELFRLEKMSDDSISAIRGFWAELLQAKTDFNTASLGFIRKMTLSTKSSYIDAIEKFPNSQQILNSYCRFLCEACGDYIECVRVGQKMRLIEQGKNINADHCFHSFVNVFPHYLKKGILNTKGSFIVKGGSSFSSSQSSTTLSSDKLTASFDNVRGMPINNNIDYSKKNMNTNNFISNRKKYKEEFENLIEQENFELLINTLFSAGKRRLTIQQIVDQSSNSSLNLARLISAVQCVMSILIVILAFIYITFIRDPSKIIESSSRVSKIASSIQYCSLIAGVQYLIEVNDTNITSKIIDFLNIREENLPDFPCTFVSPIISFNNKKAEIIDLIDQEMKFLMNNPDEHIKEIQLYNYIKLDEEESSQTLDASKNKLIKKFNEEKHNNKFTAKNYNKFSDENYDSNSFFKEDQNNEQYSSIYIFKYKDKQQYIFGITLRNGIEFFLSSVERLAYEKSLYMIDNLPKQPPPDGPPPDTPPSIQTVDSDINISSLFDKYFEILTNGLSLSQPFLRLFELISENGVQSVNASDVTMSAVGDSILVLFVIIFIILRIYNFVGIKQSIAITSTVMQKIKANDIVETMKPIYLKSKKGIKIHSGSNHSIYDYSYIFVIYFMVTILSIVAFACFFGSFIFIFSNLFSFLKKTFKWSNDSARRSLLLTDLMNCLIVDRIGLFNLDVSNTLPKNVSNLLNITQKLDLSIIGKERELDNFYFMVNDNTMDYENVIINISEISPASKAPFSVKSRKKSVKSFNYDAISPFISVSNDQCTSLDNSNESTQMNFATYLNCISIDNKINLGIHYYQLLQNALQNSEENLIDVPEFIATLFIIDKHLYRDLPNFQDKISYISKTELIKQKNQVFIVGALGIVVSIIFMLIELILIQNIYFSYDAFKQLIMVLPPTAYVSNPCLINFLINTCSKYKFFSNTSKKFMSNLSSKMSHIRGNFLSEEEILINSVDHSVINTCKDLIIQSVNPAVQKMTGFPSDQLLGQGLLYLIPLTTSSDKTRVNLEKVPFYQRLEEIQSNSGDRIAEVNATCLTDKGTELLVQATIIGAFDKKREKSIIKPKNFLKQTRQTATNSYEHSDSEVSTTNSVDNTNNNKNENNEEDDEEFIGATIILKDISLELDQKKKVKETKKKTEALINSLIPPPVLEQIRGTKKPWFYTAENATIVKVEICGLDEYIGSMMPKQLMTCLQSLYNKINQISSTPEIVLFTGKHTNRENENENNSNEMVLNNLLNMNNTSSFHFNFNNEENENDNNQNVTYGNQAKNDSDEEEFNNNSNSNFALSQEARSKQSDPNNSDSENLDDDDDICDFNLVYNIRNDNDNFISICGLFDTQTDLVKQAESCVRYALKIKKIVENISLEEQFNLFIHARIVVCMGGPVEGIVDDPNVPNIEIVTDLMKEADKMRDFADLDKVYVNQNVYDHLIKENYEIEGKIIYFNTTDDENADEAEKCKKSCILPKIYTVHRCLRKKEKFNMNNIFLIRSDSKE